MDFKISQRRITNTNESKSNQVNKKSKSKNRRKTAKHENKKRTPTDSGINSDGNVTYEGVDSDAIAEKMSAVGCASVFPAKEIVPPIPSNESAIESNDPKYSHNRATTGTTDRRSYVKSTSYDGTLTRSMSDNLLKKASLDAIIQETSGMRVTSCIGRQAEKHSATSRNFVRKTKSISRNNSEASLPKPVGKKSSTRHTKESRLVKEIVENNTRRWGAECSDTELELQRIEKYKEDRRKRYYESIRSKDSNVQSHSDTLEPNRDLSHASPPRSRQLSTSDCKVFVHDRIPLEVLTDSNVDVPDVNRVPFSSSIACNS